MSHTSSLNVASDVRYSHTPVRPSDSRLAALLDSKPAKDEVPLEVWWHLVESLRHSIAVRRAREGIERLDVHVLNAEVSQAQASALAALAQVGAGAADRRPSGCPPHLSVRSTIRELARHLVSARRTSPEALRGAVLDHLDALAAARG